MEVLAIGLLALGAASSVTGQYIYYPVNGTATPPACTSCGGSANKYDKATPATYFTSFAWSQYSQAVRTATPAPTFTSTPYYAKPYSQLSQYAPNAPTTTYGNWYPNATATPTDTGVKYGQAAWTSLWNAGNPVNFTRGLYSTTVSPTPVPTAELILPDPLYFNSSDCYKFKKDFILGVAGSAGQIEGAAADEGKSPTLLDLAPFQDPVYVADENYWLYKQDLKRIADMGIKYYSFSISWARIVPFVTAGSPVNAPGLAHYDSLINYAISLGVHPVVTLLHIDTPFALFQNRSHIAPGGYYNPLKAFTNGGFELDNFYDDFTYYGKIVMAHFADRVGHWVTVNEPYYGLANPTGVANFLKSHAELYHYYHDTLKGSGKVTFKQAGPIGIPLNPKNQSHIEATNRYNDFLSSLLSNPIYLGEDFPESYKQTFPDYVALNASEKAYVNGTAGQSRLDNCLPCVRNADCATSPRHRCILPGSVHPKLDHPGPQRYFCLRAQPERPPVPAVRSPDRCYAEQLEHRLSIECLRLQCTPAVPPRPQLGMEHFQDAHPDQRVWLPRLWRGREDARWPAIRYPALPVLLEHHVRDAQSHLGRWRRLGWSPRMVLHR